MPYDQSYAQPRYDFSGFESLGESIGNAIGDYRVNRQIQDAYKKTGGNFQDMTKALLEAGNTKAAAIINKFQNGGLTPWQQADLALRIRGQDRPPTGYERGDDGTMKYIPGGPADPNVLRTQPSRLNTPPGYAWNDPTNPEAGMHAIPGGPGEKVEAEVAGRLGMAKSFIGQVPELKRRIMAGESAGITGNIQGYAGIGGPGEIRRQMDSGADALLRMLTGAGLNQAEASDYVRRYRYDPTDGTQTRLSKVDQLVRELQSVGETVGRGRGGISLTPTQAAPTTPPAVAPSPTMNPIPGANYSTPNPEGGFGFGATPMANKRTAPTPEKEQQMQKWAQEAIDAGVPIELITKRMQELGY